MPYLREPLDAAEALPGHHLDALVETRLVKLFFHLRSNTMV